MRGLVVFLAILVGAACEGGADDAGGGGGAGAASGGASGSGGSALGGTGGFATGGSASSDAAADSSGGDVTAEADVAVEVNNDGSGGAPPLGGHAMWVWDGQKLVDPSARSALFAFAGARGVKRLFVNGYPELLPTSPKYAPAAWRVALEDAGTHGIAVEVMFGDSTWSAPGAEQSWAIANLIIPLAAFVKDAATKVKPAALHLDVEPHGLAAWTNGSAQTRQQLIASLCDFFVLTRTKLDENGAAFLPLHADLPSWWDSATYTFSYAGKQATGYEHALGKLSAVALMAYSNQEAAVLANSSKEVDLSDPTGKRLWIGVETDPAHPTDALVSKPLLESALSALEAKYGSRASYAGWAVHEYAFWSAMAGY